MIAEYEGADEHKPFCLYGLDGDHKHLPEMWKFSGCEKQPLFVPSVDHSFCGMVVSTPCPRNFSLVLASIAQPCTRSGARTTRTAPL